MREGKNAAVRGWGGARTGGSREKRGMEGVLGEEGGGWGGWAGMLGGDVKIGGGRVLRGVSWCGVGGMGAGKNLRA